MYERTPWTEETNRRQHPDSLIKAGLITEKPFTITADGRATIGARAAGTLRTDTKQAQVIAMLRGADGATVDEIAAATGWQRHTVRGAIAGAFKKKLRLDVISEKIEGRGRVYRVR